jgi:hypothetical protein
VSNLDFEMLVIGLLRDAELLGCADRRQLKPHLLLIEAAQDEIARAVEKARERIAA